MVCPLTATLREKQAWGQGIPFLCLKIPKNTNKSHRYGKLRTSHNFIKWHYPNSNHSIKASCRNIVSLNRTGTQTFLLFPY